MKKFFLLFGILCFIQSFAQEPSEIEWAKTYGGADEDRGYSVQMTTDGGYVVAGASKSSDGDVAENKGLLDFWIVKVDALGELQWERTYGGSRHDIAYHIEQTNDGGYIMVGSARSDDGDVSNHISSADGSDVWVVKLNELGEKEWDRCYGGFGIDTGYCIKQTADGGYVVSAYSTSSSGDVTGNHGYGTGDFWIFKITEIGELEWQKCYGGEEYERAFSIALTSDGGYITTGQSHSWAGSGNVSNHHGGADYWVVKMDQLGELEWERSYGGTGGDYPYSIVESSEGGYIVAGKSYSTNGDISQNLGSGDAWVVKLDNTGNIEWEKNYGGTGDEGGDFILSVRLIEIPGKGYFLLTFTDEVEFRMLTSLDIWVFRLDYSGNILWSKSMGGTRDEYTTGVSLAHDGGFIIIGRTFSGDVIFNENKGYGDMYLIKLGPEQMSVSEENTNPVLIYPNPVKDILNFSESLQNIEVLNLNGQKLLDKREGDNVEVQRLPKGTYILKARNFKGEAIRFKFIKN